MDRYEQEQIFIREVDKRIDQIADEFDLDAFFVLGYLARTMHRIQTDLDFEEDMEQLEDEDD
jgi:hypothetical protein